MEAVVQTLQETWPWHKVLTDGRPGELRGDKNGLGMFDLHRRNLTQNEGNRAFREVDYTSQAAFCCTFATIP
jgi:hypothetical protein